MDGLGRSRSARVKRQYMLCTGSGQKTAYRNEKARKLVLFPQVLHHVLPFLLSQSNLNVPDKLTLLERLHRSSMRILRFEPLPVIVSSSGFRKPVLRRLLDFCLETGAFLLRLHSSGFAIVGVGGVLLVVVRGAGEGDVGVAWSADCVENRQLNKGTTRPVPPLLAASAGVGMDAVWTFAGEAVRGEECLLDCRRRDSVSFHGY
jgi:hypothetical protein